MRFPVSGSLIFMGKNMSRRSRVAGIPANTKHLYNTYTTSAQRLRRWSNIVKVLYKCFVFAGTLVTYICLLCDDNIEIDDLSRVIMTCYNGPRHVTMNPRHA